MTTTVQAPTGLDDDVAAAEPGRVHAAVLDGCVLSTWHPAVVARAARRDAEEAR